MRLDELERLAAAATPGPWSARRLGVVIGGIEREFTRGKGQDQLFMCCTVDDDNAGSQQGNAEFIAAMSPDEAAKLIAVVRAAITLMDPKERAAGIRMAEGRALRAALAHLAGQPYTGGQG